MTILLRTTRILGLRNIHPSGAQTRISRLGRRNKTTPVSPEKSNPPPRAPPESPKQSGEIFVQPGDAAVPPIDIPSSLWHRRLGAVTDFFRWFHRTQQKRPLTVQLCTSLAVYLLGDLLAQDVGGERYDPWRTLRMLTIGAIASVPGYKWFMFLGNHFNYPGARIRSITTKVVIQQIVFAPIFNTYFFGMQAILTGERPSGVIERVKNAVPESVMNSMKLWPAVTAFSFAFVAAQYRFMFAGVFAVIWQSYLSFLNRREEKDARAADPVVQAAAAAAEKQDIKLNEPIIKE